MPFFSLQMLCEWWMPGKQNQYFLHLHPRFAIYITNIDERLETSMSSLQSSVDDVPAPSSPSHHTTAVNDSASSSSTSSNANAATTTTTHSHRAHSHRDHSLRGHGTTQDKEKEKEHREKDKDWLKTYRKLNTNHSVFFKSSKINQWPPSCGAATPIIFNNFETIFSYAVNWNATKHKPIKYTKKTSKLACHQNDLQHFRLQSTPPWPNATFHQRQQYDR